MSQQCEAITSLPCATPWPGANPGLARVLSCGAVGSLLLALCAPVRAAEPNQPVPVTSSPLRVLAIYPELFAPATVLNLNDSELSAEVTARIEAIPVRVGDVVAKGKVLIRLDAKDYRLEQSQAEATLASLDARQRLAKAQLQRVQKLAKKRSASLDLLNQRQSDVQSLHAEIRAQRVAIDIAKRKQDKCTLRAPFETLVLQRLGSVGELATPGKSLLRVLQVGNTEVSAKVQANDIPALREATEVLFVSQGKSYPVAIRTVVAAFDQRERSREVRLRFTAEQALSYATGQLLWRRGQAYIPPHLLVQRDGGLGVFLLVDGEARFVLLEGAQDGRPAATELPLDSRIIVDGRFRIRAGDPVTTERP